MVVVYPSARNLARKQFDFSTMEDGRNRSQSSERVTYLTENRTLTPVLCCVEASVEAQIENFYVQHRLQRWFYSSSHSSRVYMATRIRKANKTTVPQPVVNKE